MNQLFDFRRLRLLVTKHWYENSKKYGLSLIAIAGLLLIWFVFTMIAEPYRPIDEPLQAGTYFVGLFLVGCLYASLLFADLASKSKGINYLAVPASHLEKLLCNLFYGVLVFFVCYTAIFYLVDITAVKIANGIAAHQWQKTHPTNAVFQDGNVINVFVMPHRGPGVPNIFFYILLAYVAVQAAFILGSVYFPKYSFIKTVISLFLTAMLLGLFLVKVLHPMLPNGNFYEGFTGYNFYAENDVSNGKIVLLPDWVGQSLEILAKFAFAPLFWMTTYFRLKEKEV